SEIIAVSARNGTHMDEWFLKIMSQEQQARAAMDVNYQTYAEGEALLGWLNCTVQLSAAVAFNADDFLKDLAREVQARLKEQNSEIAHLKMTFSPDSGLGEIAVVNLVRNDFVPELSMHLEERIERAQLL